MSLGVMYSAQLIGSSTTAMFAPRDSIERTVPAKCLRAAYATGVLSEVPFFSMLNPFANSSSLTATSPLRHAMWSGLHPQGKPSGRPIV
ncbi:hypothetical protein DPMN_072412 [Dreissena polymorpha]|uniref:Uncharacterized protein n=1 Tax=Dreissena polymorpha TaxID=45954 RepID=A0A9D3Z668_DREPO|nr:hypothetical protein DPMN_072412 [Dreissena polymorpha]